ncbi:phosphopantetheine-binding protein [Engelhardtia mirabilis]|uniref:Carrier domain-containing protein n=1 Tax=Engelhardtia mirabilis TaxID=2528011 RepID=A0A518BN94_9BACT|nr:hypothetical protein Pla133_35420 [Planctomycetes bacterium Pla133]QDV02770.1 hypothetical protein Pla86_35400 [Planctomycetes bacterium Pla86]
MDRNQFVAALESALQIDKGILTPETVLDSLESWDSLGVLEFQALADEELNVQVEPTEIGVCRTVEDLWKLMQAGEKS